MIDRFQTSLYQPINPFPPLFTLEDMDATYQWIIRLRKKYSPNSDIWNLRRDWENIKGEMLEQLNDGSYQFGVIDRLEFEDATISLWSSRDMVALKLISQALGRRMVKYIPKSCCHIKNHGGLKKAVRQTYEALPEYQYVMRSDVQGYYASICFDVLIEIIESYVTHPILLTLVRKACLRTETSGGNFYDYHEKGVPKGSPLSPLLGAIALMPLDKAMGKIKGVFYQRYMDDWCVLTKSKSALRKVVKRTHEVMRDLKFRLHPLKTYIGKISRGFNFLAYYMDYEKILPSKETIRRFHERATALYETPQSGNNQAHRRRRHAPKTVVSRDISEYLVSEAAPTNTYLESVLQNLLALAARSPDTFAAMRRRFDLWKSWLKSGITNLEEFATSVQNFLPCMFSCFMQGSAVPVMGSAVVG
jgi:hypothetical protein